MQRFWTLFIIVIFVLIAVSNVSSQETSLEPVQRLGARGLVADAAWSPDGELIAISTENRLDIFDKDLNFVTHWQPSFQPASSHLTWNADGTLLALTPANQSFYRQVNTVDAYLYIWSFETNDVIYSVEGLNHSGKPGVWNADGTLLVFYYSTDTTQWLVVVDTVSREEVYVDLAELDLIRDFLWDWSWKDDRLVGVNAAVQQRVTIDYKQGQVIQLETIPEPSFEPAPISSPDGSAIVEPDAGVMRLTTTRGQEVIFQNVERPSRFRGLHSAIWSPDSRHVALLANTGVPQIIVANAETGTTIIEVVTDQMSFLEDQVLFNAQGNRLLIFTSVGDELLLYDLPSGNLIERRLHLMGTNAIDLNPDGTQLATAPVFRPHGFVWDTETGETDLFLNSPHDPIDTTKPIFNVAWSPDGRYIATGSIAYAPTSAEVVPIDIFIWDAATGEHLQTVETEAVSGDFVIALDWSSDSRYLAWTVLSNQTGRSHVGVWDVENQERLYHEQFPGSISDIAFATDSHHLTIGIMGVFDELEERTLIGDINIATGTFTILHEFEEWTGIKSLDWNHDSTILATAQRFFEEDYTLIEFWQVTISGELVKVYEQLLLKPNPSSETDIEWNPIDDSLAIGYPTVANGRTYYIFDYLHFNRDTMTITAAETYLPDVRDVSHIPYIQTYLGIAWSGDGQRLAVGTFANAVWIYER